MFARAQTSYQNRDTVFEFSDPDFLQDGTISVIDGHLLFKLSSPHPVLVLEYTRVIDKILDGVLDQ